MNEKPCPFCDQDEFASRTVLETRGFIVTPTFGQVVEGYVLIIPKRHMACLGALNDEELSEYEDVHDRMRTAIRQAYGVDAIAFEHGVVGQTVAHAHMHMVPPPQGAGFLSRIVEDFPSFEITSSFRSLQNAYRLDGRYLAYEKPSLDMYLFRIPEEEKPRPQYLRLLFAEAAGRPERGNWRNMDPELDKRLIAETCRNLKAVL